MKGVSISVFISRPKLLAHFRVHFREAKCEISTDMWSCQLDNMSVEETVVHTWIYNFTFNAITVVLSVKWMRKCVFITFYTALIVLNVKYIRECRFHSIRYVMNVVSMNTDSIFTLIASYIKRTHTRKCIVSTYNRYCYSWDKRGNQIEIWKY